MELPVRALERLGHTLDPLYNIQPADQVLIQLAGVADHTDDRGKIPGGNMGAQVLRLDPLEQLLDPLFFGVLLDKDNHVDHSFLFWGRAGIKRGLRRSVIHRRPV